MASSGVVGPTSTAVIEATTAFFNAYLKHEHGALQLVAADGRSSQTTVHTAWAQGSRSTLPVPKVAAVHLHATVAPDTGLHGGQAVTVHWSGYTPGKVVDILACSTVQISTASGRLQLCQHGDFASRPNRIGFVVLHIATGVIGNGTCDAAHSCYVVVNNPQLDRPCG